MSHRHLPANLSKTNRHRFLKQVKTLVSAMLVSSGILTPTLMAWAQTAAPPGTVIINQAMGSFTDPVDNRTETVVSNEVRVEVAEVAGITVVENGYQEPIDGIVNAGNIVYVDFVITNVGNDPTQFVIPDAVSVTNGTQVGDIQIVEYDADGAGPGAAEDLSGSNITVPNGGSPTGSLLTGVANANNGSVLVDGSITVRVPVQVGAAGLDLTVTLGDSSVTGGQNEAYVVVFNKVFQC